MVQGQPENELRPLCFSLTEDELRAIHDELLQSVGAASGHLARLDLTSFFPMKGRAATGELMVIGRAVNGWASKWTRQKAKQPRGRAEILGEIFDRSV